MSGRTTLAAKASEARRRRKPSAKAAKNAARRRQTDRKPFIGCDGEGSGQDEQGRQLFYVLRCGDAELFTGKPLSTVECLEHILAMPAKAIPVGFSFGYDTTMILRDLPDERRDWLLGYETVTGDDGESIRRKRDRGTGSLRYTYWNDYALEYLPRNYLRVARTVRVPGGRGSGRRVVKGSARTIYEVFGFFQASFLTALANFDIGSAEQRAEIKANKEARDGFDATSDRTRAYNELECDLLAQLMERFREVCLAADIRPRTWNGAGKLAKAMHAKHDTPTRVQIVQTVPIDVLRMASDAYYGGRFEITRVGEIAGPIWQYDIRSAYPAAMGGLPCLTHGKWVRLTGGTAHYSPSAIFVAPVRFWHDGARPICGLPVRKKDGRLFWPREGQGVYWSTELRAAARLGMQFELTGGGWLYEKACDCHPFDWVEPVYQYRQSLGAATIGYPIKLGINSLYGTLAQRVGVPKYGNLIWAGMITAWTRARLMEAAAVDPAAVVMMATDALFTTREIPGLDLSRRLGAWEAEQYPRLFVVQPGLYWGAKKPKTRGVDSKFFADKTDAFEAAWQRFVLEDEALAGAAKPPVVQLPIRLFVGLKLAQARGKPETAGQWVDTTRAFSFDWHGKRGQHRWIGGKCVTYPAPGGPDLVSKPHAFDPLLIEGIDLDREELEDQPDYVDLGPPF